MHRHTHTPVRTVPDMLILLAAVRCGLVDQGSRLAVITEPWSGTDYPHLAPHLNGAQTGSGLTLAPMTAGDLLKLVDGGEDRWCPDCTEFLDVQVPLVDWETHRAPLNWLARAHQVHTELTDAVLGEFTDQMPWLGEAILLLQEHALRPAPADTDRVTAAVTAAADELAVLIEEIRDLDSYRTVLHDTYPDHASGPPQDWDWVLEQPWKQGSVIGNTYQEFCVLFAFGATLHEPVGSASRQMLLLARVPHGGRPELPLRTCHDRGYTPALVREAYEANDTSSGMSFDDWIQAYEAAATETPAVAPVAVPA